MNEASIIVTDLLTKIIGKNEIEMDRIFAYNDSYTIFHPDVMRDSIQNALKTSGLLEKDAIIQTDEILNQLKRKFKDLNILFLDCWVGRFESSSCKDCPAYRWVIHREGVHNCRLGFDIDESKSDETWSAVPTHECIRPFNVGACYLIARELFRPEPIVGKLDAYQYEQYIKEKKQLCL